MAVVGPSSPDPGVRGALKIHVGLCGGSGGLQRRRVGGHALVATAAHIRLLPWRSPLSSCPTTIRASCPLCVSDEVGGGVYRAFLLFPILDSATGGSCSLFFTDPNYPYRLCVRRDALHGSDVRDEAFAMAASATTMAIF
ncbi:hypothetical protein ACP70R_028567 [Stipagrostis hirtigluma subsp. patula]